MPTRTFRNEHDRIMRQASALSGIARTRMTRDVATEAHGLVLGLDRLLVAHLEAEDGWMYPLLLTSPDPAVRQAALDAVADMGGIRGAWTGYRDRWSIDAILADPSRFALATDGIIGALALRVERENGQLYPMVEQMAASTLPSGPAA